MVSDLFVLLFVQNGIRCIEDFSKSVKIERAGIAAGHTRGLKKICQIGYLQPMKSSGYKNQLIRDEKVKYSAPPAAVH